MGLHRLEDTSKVREIFAGWEDTCVWSCQQKVMGTILVTDTEAPKSAIAVVGCFAFCAGEPDRELLEGKPAGFFIMVPENEAWSASLEECFPDCKRVTRYAIRKDTQFDRARLEQYRQMLPDGYELRKIDGELYDLCLTDPETASFVACFESKEQFLTLGRGFVILREGRIVSGASSYSRYLEGIEVEVATVREERQKGLARVCCAALILQCLSEGLYPSWDAHNPISVHLAETLGYRFSHEYPAYEVDSTWRTH